MTTNIWITGGSSGIGAETALQYAQAGSRVAISARGIDKLEDTAKKADELEGSISAYACDVTNPEELTTAFDSIVQDFKTVDLVIFNAGTYKQTPAEDDFSIEPYQQSIDINYIGVINCLATVIPHMKKNGSGKIAIVSSLAGFSGLPNSAAYGASKAALINLCETLKIDLMRYGISVHLITPGFVRTPMTDVNEFPMPFLMEPEDAASAIIQGLEKNKFLIAFPLSFALILRILRLLPYPLYFPLVKRLTKS